MNDSTGIDGTGASFRGLLQLLASPVDQRQYAEDVPIADVPAELVCMRFDDIYHPNAGFFRDPFSDEEQAILTRFNAFYDTEVKGYPSTHEIAVLQASESWRVVTAASADTLSALGWTD